MRRCTVERANIDPDSLCGSATGVTGMAGVIRVVRSRPDSAPALTGHEHPSRMPGSNMSATARNELRQVALRDFKSELASLPRVDLPRLGNSAAEGSRHTVQCKLPAALCEQI